MANYKLINWVNHKVDIETGDIIEQGTPLSENNLNHMDIGIFEAHGQLNKMDADLMRLYLEVAVLKNTTVNDMKYNVFFENIDNLDGIKLTSGIFDIANNLIYI